jgi:phage shock protein PspC (stress-responsive transcriptional regulator)
MKRLKRPHGEIAGVCKGLSEYFNIDESIIRIMFVVLVFTPFPIIITYLLMWMIIPFERYENNQDNSE